MLLLVGCAPSLRHVAVDRVPLGKVVVYRNGVAFYERRAHVDGGTLTVRVPRARVDDFLKSLTVVDARTGRALPVAFPRRQADDAPVIEMQLDVGAVGSHADVVMTYVTDAAAWKPSYRLVLGRDDALLEGWAVVDNLSGEDWKDVVVGVGSSAAMSFRYDLWSVRTVERAALAPAASFAVAPPTAVSPYGAAPDPVAAAAPLLTLDASEIRGPDVASGETSGRAPTPPPAPAPGPSAAPTPSVAPARAPAAGPAAAPIPSAAPNPAATLAGARGTGAIQGRVVDSWNDSGLAGVTVAITGAASYTAITDQDGSYRVADLVPGEYLVTFFFGDVTIERRNIRVGVNKTTPVFQKINTAAAVSETIILNDRPPVIDPTSTTQGITIDQDYTRNIPVPGRTFDATLGTASGARDEGAARRSPPTPPPDPYRAVKLGDQKLAEVSAQLVASRQRVLVQGYAAPGEPRAEATALARANLVRDQLIDAGVAPGQIAVAGAIGGAAAVQLITGAAPPVGEVARRARARDATADAPPVGESLFASSSAMTVGDGTSAMVSVLRARTTGRQVYLFDRAGARGNARYAFRAVRLENPTDATLEAGPITVYGDDRYVGEGLTEAIAPHAAVVIPYALDRQIVVERTEASRDELARLLTVQRGVVTAEVQHLRATTLTITSRLRAPTTVYVRHAVEPGWALLDPGLPTERLGQASLIAVELAAGATRTVELREATPMTRQLDLDAEPTLAQLAVYVASARPSPALRAQLQAILAAHAALIDSGARVATLREQAEELRLRDAELIAQLTGLRKVPTAVGLVRHLQDKVAEVATRLQATTIAIVEGQEQQLLARVRFADALTELHLDDARAAAP
ncbi:MAG: carboxypeptidase regulatory-like domain-containing protein [Myxococcales bacterium]|nr:carboxypeptidase regulatory-like domain-containing protein [Myxococcales bacterium]